jgi:tetratricopeptide (TPR) repeat protein
VGHLKWTALVAALLCTACTAADRDALAICADETSHERAVATCTQLLDQGRLDPAKREYVLFSRGQAYDVAGKTDEAIADFGAVIELQPGSSMAHGSRGALYLRQRRLDEALVDLERALVLDPQDFYALTNRGTIAEQRGQYRRALEDFDRAIFLAPDETVPYGARCWTRAIIAEDLEGAVADCTKAMTSDPDPNLRNSRGFAYYRMQRHAEAIADYDAAIAGDPNVASSYYVRGLSRRALGDAAAAKADIERAVALEPGVAARYAGYGVVAD